MTSNTAQPLHPYLDASQRLRQCGISPTRQRLQIAMVLLNQPGHMSAQDLYELVNRGQRTVCRATIYNTLHLFVNRGLIREVSVDSSRTFYDTNIDPHYHIYNADTGQLIDVPPEKVVFDALPAIPEGTRQEEITLIIRVRNQSSALRTMDSGND